MFALHQVLLVVLTQDQVYTAVGALAAGFGDAVSLAAEGFANELLKLLPAEAVDGFAGLGGGGDAAQQLLAFVARDNRANGAQAAGNGDEVLAEQGKGAPELRGENAAHIAWLDRRRRGNRCGGDGVQYQPADQTNDQACPPGQT